MLDFGKELKAAREAKGLTIANIAEKTHIMSVVLEDLENENFSRIVAPIYGRGFVKLYCETVGLDPKPFIAEFMDIYNGNRDPAIRERAVVPPPAPETSPIAAPMPAPEPTPVEDNYDDRLPTTDERAAEPTREQVVAEPTPEQIAEPPPAPEPEPVPPPQPSLFDPPSTWAVPKAPVEEPAIRSFYETPESSPLPATDEPPAPAKPRFTHYSAPLSDRFADVTALGPTILRWAILGLAALLILWGIVAGIRALYRATSTPTEPAPEEVVETTQTSSPSAASAEEGQTSQPAAPRTPIAVPPLYID